MSPFLELQSSNKRRYMQTFCLFSGKHIKHMRVHHNMAVHTTSLSEGVIDHPTVLIAVQLAFDHMTEGVSSIEDKRNNVLATGVKNFRGQSGDDYTS